MTIRIKTIMSAPNIRMTGIEMIGDVSLLKEDWIESLTGSVMDENIPFVFLVTALLTAVAAFLILFVAVVMNELF
jgi:hypothetical protein